MRIEGRRVQTDDQGFVRMRGGRNAEILARRSVRRQRLKDDVRDRKAEVARGIHHDALFAQASCFFGRGARLHDGGGKVVR